MQETSATAPAAPTDRRHAVVPLPSRTREGPPLSADGTWTQGALALSFAPLPDPATRVRLVPTAHEPPPDLADAPRPDAWAGAFVQSIIDVIAGERAAAQMMRWVDEYVYVELARRQAAVAERRRANPGVRPLRQRVASVHVQQAASAHVEIAARIQIGQRSRAFAAGLDLRPDGWVCTGLSLG